MSGSIGIVIPLHDKRAYVQRAVESVLRQTYDNFKLTVVDDGSTDGGDECVARIADPRVRLIRTANRGPGAARNLGMRTSQADWVALLDADDAWKPTFLERTVAAAQRVPGIVAVFTGIHVLDGPAAPLVATEALINDYHAARMRLGISMSSSSVLLRRTTFLSMGGFREDHRYAEDIEAWFRLACEGPSFYVGEALSGIEVSDPGAARRQGDPLERAAGLQMLLDSYEAYRRTARIPPGQARSCRRFMEHQRGRLALHLFNANQRAHGARVLLTGVPFGFHTWREYAQCTAAAFARGRSQDAVDRG